MQHYDIDLRSGLRHEIASSSRIRAQLLRVVASLALLSVVPPAVAQFQAAPDHEQWQAAVAATAEASAAADIDAIKAGVRALFEQARRMPDTDTRLAETASLFDQAIRQLALLGEDSDIVELLESLNDATKVPDGLASSFSRAPARLLAEKWLAEGEFEKARTLMADLAERADADFGTAHPAARLGRRLEAAASAGLGDHEAALARLDDLLGVTARTFGPESSEAANILISKAKVELQRGRIDNALRNADEAASLVTGRPIPQAPALFLEIARIYDESRAFAKARDTYQRLDSSAGVDTRGYVAAQVPILLRLSYLNARLGDGAAARRYLERAMESARNVGPRQPSLLIDALLRSAELQNHAGRHDLAVESLERAEQVAADSGIDRLPELRRRLASAFLAAQSHERAWSLARELLEESEPGTSAHASTATLAALIGAQMDPPEPRTDLARAALDFRRDEEPGQEPYYEMYALALSLAAEGRWERSLELQQSIIDGETAEYGAYATNWQQWRNYAVALDRVGREDDARRVRTRLERETASLAAAFSGMEPTSVTLFERNPFGFSVSLTDDRWQRWSPEATGWPLAAFSAQYHPEPGRTDATFAVIPLLMPDGLTSQTAIDVLSDIVSPTSSLSLTPWSDGSLVGYEFEFAQTNVPGRPYTYRGRLIVQEHAVYLVVAAAFDQSSEALEAAGLALDQVSIDEPVDANALDASGRELHALILNSVGNVLSSRDRDVEAIEIYELSRRFDENETITHNIVFAHLRLGHFRSVVEELDTYSGNLRDSPELLLWRAISHTELGREEDAIADYAAAFDAGIRDDDSASDYVDLLVSRDRSAEALAFLDDYAAVQLTPDIIAMQIVASHAAGDQVRLDQALSRVEDPTVSSPEAALVGALAYLNRDDVAGLGAYASRLDEASLATPELYVLLATAQIDQQLLPAARESVARGLSLAPNNQQLIELEAYLESLAGTEL